MLFRSVVSQLLTLYITPVFYTYMESFQQWIGARRRRHPAPELEGEAEQVLAAENHNHEASKVGD